MGCKMKIRKLIIVNLFVTLLVIALSSTTIMGAEWEVIDVSFDPTGAINLNVYPSVVNYSTVTGGSDEDSVAITLQNNGSVAMDTDISTNATTEEADLTLDETGSPGEDDFSLQVVDGTVSGNNNYITVAGAVLDIDLAGGSPGATHTFEIEIELGPISVNHGWQNIDVNCTGSAST